MRSPSRITMVLILLVLGGCVRNLSPLPLVVSPTSVPLGSPSLVPYSTAMPTPIATQRPSTTLVFPTAGPVSTPTPMPTPSCADIAPFAPGCLDRDRPAELASEIAFVGVLPSDSISEAAWSPDGRCLAYGILTSTESIVSEVQVRCQPDFQLAGRWNVPFLLPFGLLWTLDGRALVFFFLRDDGSSIGLAQLNRIEWQDLFVGKSPPHAASIGRQFAGWLDDTTLAFTHAVGTGVAEFHWLDVTTGEILSSPDPESLGGLDQLFSPDRRWLAADDFGGVIPRAIVWELSRPDEPICLSNVFGTEHSDAQFWLGDSLGVVVYPPGNEWKDATTLPHPDLYFWNAGGGETQLVARGAFRAVAAPTGDRLAVVFFGEPHNGDEVVETTGTLPYLGLLEWPGGHLLATYPLGDEEFPGIWSVPHLTAPAWSPDGQWLALPLYGGGLVLMDRSGNIQPVLSNRQIEWAGWGSNGSLAMLIDNSIWLVRVPPLDGK